MTAKLIRRGILIAAALAVAAIVLPPFINVGRYKGKVTESMSTALGRPVTADDIELRLFPQPGFHLDNVAIGDDPAYSAEPILHAEEVTAYLRISSLWRGRLEIARLNLNYPSLNLVERPDASWNLESLLWKASRTQAAPTGAPVSSSRSRFPYIEATNGRINFKYGLEKSVFSFTDADFTLWSPAESQWRMRLEARPVRTDMPVTDTGTLKAEATIQRANLLRDAPMKANFTWERVQLGNLTRLVYGEDGGWRGALETSAQLEGTPAALHFTTAAKLRDFRRFDISSDDSANLNATCTGVLNVGENLVHDTSCSLPIQDGMLSVQGSLRGIHVPHYDLSINAENLGTGALLNLARRAKRDLPDDLTAKGTISGSFHASRMTNEPSTWVGSMSVNNLIVHSAVLGKDISIAKAIATADTASSPAPDPKHRGHGQPPAAPVRALVLQPFDLPFGANAPAKIDGSLDDEKFALHIKGDASLERLQQFARAIGVGAPKIAITGPANVDLTIGGNWAGFAPPDVSGTAQLKNVRAQVPGLTAPVQIASAHVDLNHGRFALHNASAAIGKVSLAGSANFPRFCNSESSCESTFDLTTDDLNPERWNEILNPHIKKNPWYRLFGSSDKANVISTLRASGHLAAKRITLGTTTGASFETAFSLANGILDLKNAHADILGGTVASDWQIDFTQSEPKYVSTGTATRIQAEKMTPLLDASLGTGTLAIQYKLQMSGLDQSSLAKSAIAETTFSWHGGTLRISPDVRTPLRVATGEGTANLDKNGWTIANSRWETPNGAFQLNGTATRNSVIDLEFTQQSGAVGKVTGTLAKPQTSMPAPQPTQARRR